MVREATGGLERAATRALATAGLPVVVVHPRQARDGARATGPLANTEAVEARALAPCADGSARHPRPSPHPELRALLGRRQPRIGMRTAEQHRLAGASARLTKDSTAPMPWLKAALATLDDALETRRRASPRWRDNDELVPRAKGMGPVRAHTFLLARPALGTLTRQPIAAWVGVAPLHGDRGTLRGAHDLGWAGACAHRLVHAYTRGDAFPPADASV